MKYEGYADINYNNERFLDCYYFGARYYDPEIARWLAVDPLADMYPTQSSYNYVMNNPLRLIDPNGMGIFDPAYYMNGIRLSAEDFDYFSNNLNSEYQQEKQNKIEESKSKAVLETDDIALGIRTLWAYSNSGKSKDVAKESVAYIVIDKNGNLAIIIEDNSQNLPDRSFSAVSGVGTIAGEKASIYDGRLVLAQVHTHPQYSDFGVKGGKADISVVIFGKGGDVQTSRHLGSPVFSIGTQDMAYVLPGQSPVNNQVSMRSQIFNSNSFNYKKTQFMKIILQTNSNKIKRYTK